MDFLDSELDNSTDNMLKSFVEQLGFNGDVYLSSGKYPIIFANLIGLGEFCTAESKKLKSILNSCNIDQSLKQHIYKTGLITINSRYKNKPVDDDLLLTIIHEKIHARRMLFAHLPDSGNSNIDPIFYDKGRFVRNYTESKDMYIDPAQDIFLGSFDDSRKSTEYYQGLSFDEKDDIQYDTDNVSTKRYNQQMIDEALVELMAVTAYLFSTGKFDNIMDVVRKIAEKGISEEIQPMARIIVRHNDLDLFRWMIDPLTYQADSINYDFFSNYITEEDKNDVDLIINNEASIYEDMIDSLISEYQAASKK